MKTLPENTYTKHTLHERIGNHTAVDIFVRRLNYTECVDVDGLYVSVTRFETVDFPNDTSIYVVEAV